MKGFELMSQNFRYIFKYNIMELKNIKFHSTMFNFVSYIVFAIQIIIGIIVLTHIYIHFNYANYVLARTIILCFIVFVLLLFLLCVIMIIIAIIKHNTYLQFLIDWQKIYFDSNYLFFHSGNFIYKNNIKNIKKIKENKYFYLFYFYDNTLDSNYYKMFARPCIPKSIISKNDVVLLSTELNIRLKLRK